VTAPQRPYHMRKWPTTDGPTYPFWSHAVLLF